MHTPKLLRAFTLVELIVVITIVGILSTVGFVSYSGYLAGARDSNRISQMVKLSDSLQVYAATKSLPLPDDYIEITASGTTIAYQGYVGVDVLETIDYTNGGTDPKDDSYYTYYLTKDRRNMQLLALMEEQSLTTFNPLREIYAVDYTERFPKVYGKKMGILTESTTNIPAQEVPGATTLDIVTTTNSYIAHLSDDEKVEGTGSTIQSIFAYTHKNTSLDYSLIGYYDMETIDKGVLVDNSMYDNDGICHINTITSYECGSSINLKFQDSEAIFSGSGDYIRLPSDVSNVNKFTILSRFKLNNLGSQHSLVGNSFTSNSGAGYFLGVNNNDKLWVIIYDSGGISHQLYGSTVLDKERYYKAAFSFNGTKAVIYLNGVFESEKEVIGFTPRNAPTSIGLENQLYWPIDGNISEVKIYNKALGNQEIQIFSRGLK